MDELVFDQAKSIWDRGDLLASNEHSSLYYFEGHFYFLSYDSQNVIEGIALIDLRKATELFTQLEWRGVSVHETQ